MASERPWLEAIAACVPDGLVLVRADGTVLWANHEFCRQLGIAGSPKGMRLGDKLPGWESIAARASGTISVEDADGAAQEWQLSIAPCAPGMEAAFALHVRSGNELRELRERLRARERSYSFLRENTSDLIIRTDGAGIISWTNEGTPARFPVGADLRTCIAARSAEALFAAAEVSPRAVTLHSPDGARPVFVLRGVARDLADEGGAPIGISLLLRDATEEQRLARFVAEHALSAREEEIIGYVVQGYSNLNIATILGLSESGVKFHIRNVFARAKLASRTDLMARLMEA